ncbi:tripartite tricarboxylate transporter TctB family protein [Azospirillum sp. YIM B02556]|uniref:Tripartite tricarboxylate transporter TctB family protein n=1 Tax=Azospirillum endophyticum TaxID=2800326 RepID=A0ABS1FH16_9PROT|nr:tripartite tricarboxylate transporter TctB family protein [Azospirillum endophyticum]MBK1842699.1 tripartite tricarboxylate transporter TctB family protein [Azospirillum endophyticum]
MAACARNPKDFFAGVIYIAVGLVAVWIGRDYATGTGSRMGPGYFPAVLGWLLAAFGVLSVLRSFVQDGSPIGTVAWKGLALVAGSTVLFGLLLESAGLIPALLALILVSAAASRMFRFEIRAAAGLVALLAFCALVFVKGLGVPMALLGSWFTG